MEPLIKKYKVLIIGDSCVGKTSILLRHVDGQFHEEITGTIGVDYRSNTYVRDGQRYDLQIWDTAGQERFRNVTKAYYRDAHAALLVFDLTKHESFRSITQWHDQLLKQLNRPAGDLVTILVGNKSDRPLSEYQVTPTQIQELASTLGISTYIQTSAKEGTRIEIGRAHV